MSQSISIGLIGDAQTAEALGSAIDFLPGFCIAVWSPTDRDTKPDARPVSNCEVKPDWHSVVTDPSITAIVVADRSLRSRQIVPLALEHGKAVLYPSPVAEDLAALHVIREAASRGGGRLLAPGPMSRTAAGAIAVKAAREESLGRLHSLYVAVRLPQGRSADVVTDLGWSAFQFVLACVGAPLERVYASGGNLFDPRAAQDTLVTHLRFADGTVVTVELSCCLPATVACPPQGLVEFELIGAREALRGEPYRPVVSLFTEKEAAAIPWTDDGWEPMLRELPAVIAGDIPPDRDLTAQQRLIALVDALRRSLDQERSIRLESHYHRQYL